MNDSQYHYTMPACGYVYKWLGCAPYARAHDDQASLSILKKAPNKWEYNRVNDGGVRDVGQPKAPVYSFYPRAHVHMLAEVGKTQ